MSSHNITELKIKSIHSISTLLIREVFLKAFVIMGQFVLVRILLPQYFGILAIITFIVSILDLISDVGLSMIITQNKKELSSLQLNSIFITKMLLTGGGVVAVLLLSPFLKLFYTQLTFENILMIGVIVLVSFLKPVRTILTALIERDLKYNHIAIIDIS